MGAAIGDEPEHMWGCEILKMDAASWLQASDHVAISQLSLFVLSRFCWFTAYRIASFEVLSEMTCHQWGQHRRGRFGASWLENDQGWIHQHEDERRGESWTNMAGFTKL